MSLDREFFIKCLTQGLPVYGAHSGLEFNFADSLNEYLESNSTGEFFSYLGDKRNVILFEIKINRPILGLAIENELLTFFQEDPVSMQYISEKERNAMGQITLQVVSFVSAWNKKTMGISNKKEYNSLASMKEKYSVSDLTKLYKVNLLKHKGMIEVKK